MHPDCPADRGGANPHPDVRSTPKYGATAVYQMPAHPVGSARPCSTHGGGTTAPAILFTHQALAEHALDQHRREGDVATGCSHGTG